MFASNTSQVANGSVLGVEDVFSTYLYTGNGAQQDIKNNIQLGGLPTNGTITHLTGESLTDSAPVPCGITNSGVTVSTTQKKYGASSYYYDGTGTRNLIASSPDLRFGTGDFTVECWVYNSSAGNQGIFQLGTTFGAAKCVFVSMYPNNQFQWGWDASYTGGVGSLPSNTWVHVALVRQSGVLKLYVNGTKTGSDNTYAGEIDVGRLWVGNYYDGNYAWNGYIDDLRVSNKAVYTANFTTPTAALPIDTLVAGSNYGGLTWIKSRTSPSNNWWIDTTRGALKAISSEITAAELSYPNSVTAFGSTGFTLGSNGDWNTTNGKYASWTFRRQAKFFDVVTFTGNGLSTQQIAHNLGSVPGCIIVKCTSSSNPSGFSANWNTWHRGTGSTGITNSVGRFQLNGTNAAGITNWDLTGYHTDTYFSPYWVQDASGTFGNLNGETYVAYLFAHNAGGFGTAGTDNVISCGSWTGGQAEVTLGWEPQWILSKRVDSSSGGAWVIADDLRGMPSANATVYESYLLANSSALEVAGGYNFTRPTATGFKTDTDPTGTYIYIAIRRPNKVPTSGTQVYKSVAYTGTGTGTDVNLGFPVDAYLHIGRSGSAWSNLNGYAWPLFTRLLSFNNALNTTMNTGWSGGWGSSYLTNDNNFGVRLVDNYYLNVLNGSYSIHGFKRAPGFMDVVCYTGTGAARTLNHNLGVAPELMIVKRRTNPNGDGGWAVYPNNPNRLLQLHFDSGEATISGSSSEWNGTAPTASVFSLGSYGSVCDVNASGQTFVAYLFATCPGVSKVGTYTGTGAAQTINCGFTSGARFVLIKRTDSTGDWIMYDTARGIISGNDPYIRLNSVGTEVTGTDYISPQSVGFGLTSSAPAALNASGGTYIYLAIA